MKNIQDDVSEKVGAMLDGLRSQVGRYKYHYMIKEYWGLFIGGVIEFDEIKGSVEREIYSWIT